MCDTKFKKQGCVGKFWGGAEAPPDFKLVLLCVQAVTSKGRPKLEKQERKNSFQVISSVTHTKINAYNLKAVFPLLFF